MKVLISVDMEGITGIVRGTQVDKGKDGYSEAAQLMIGDANAAVAGAFDGGADEVVVTDAHDTSTNLLIAGLDPRATLFSGPDLPLSMMHGVEGCGLALLVGYHAMMGTTAAVLDHTYSDICHRVTLNGREVGEVGISAALAGHFGVPVGLVTGDRAVCREAVALLPGIETVAVKHGEARNGALCLPPERSTALIRQAAEAAVRRAAEFRPWRPELPVEFTIEFLTSQMADRAALYPFARRDGRTIIVRGQDVLEAFRAFLTVVVLSRSPLF